MIDSTARTGRHASIPGVVAVLLVALLALFPPPLVAPAVERMSFLLFDSFQRIEPRRYEDAGVRVVDIDEETIRRLGQWPWWKSALSLLYPADIAGPREQLARLDLADRLFDRCDQLSGGQLQRVGVARVLYQRPDLLLINEFDFDEAGIAADLFQQRYLEVPQRGQRAIRYPYRYIAPVNTGVPSGLDLDHDGKAGTAKVTFTNLDEKLVEET